MVDDSASHRVFKISELTRAIASELIPISEESTVNLACTCRFLEEPVLSALWETQPWVKTLLEVLPQETWNREYVEFYNGWEFMLVGDPSPEAWNRVQRYASWMRRVSMNERDFLGEEASRQLRLNTPAGGWFPALRNLSWIIGEYDLPYIDLFFSPHLEAVRIYTPGSWNLSGFPYDILPALTSAISTIPTSALRSLSIGPGPPNASLRATPWAHFRDSLSSVVLRCGPSLVNLSSPIPLSDVAVDHLIRLPHLHTLTVDGSPPSCSTSLSPFVFPPLVNLTLGEASVHGWLSLIQSVEARASATQGVEPLSRIRESLALLNLEFPPTVPVNISSTSPIQNFRNLAFLYANIPCDEGGCIFKLDNDNATELAMALPQLEYLFLGSPCSENSCATTVACLLQISVHCPHLYSLGIHFNTTDIVGDLKSISVDPRFRELRSLPRCPLSYLKVRELPLVLDESDFDAVADGMKGIFPNLKGFETKISTWCELSKKFRGV